MGQLIGFGEACGLGSALCWGTSTLVLRSYGERLAPAWTNSVRCATASAFYWALLLGGRELGQLLHAPFDALARLLGTVVLGIGIGDTFYLHALRRMDASRTLALTGTYPVSAVIFSQLLLHERISLLLFAGVALVGLGVALLSRPAPMASTETRARRDLAVGVPLALVASVLWGFCTVVLKPALSQVSLVSANAIRMPAAAALLSVGSAWSARKVQRTPLGRRALGIIALTGLIGLGVGSLAFTASLKYAGAAKAATLSSSSPLFVLPLAALFLGERAGLREVLGLVACVLGVWLVVWAG